MTPVAIVRRALLPLLLLAVAIPFPTSSARPSPFAAASEKLVDACNQTLRPDFCLSSLSADARSTDADIHGLAAIATDLATINATAIFSKISARLLRGVDAAEDGASRSSLEACLVLYRSALTPLHFAAEFLAAKRPDVAAFMFKDPSFTPDGCNDLLGDAAFIRADFDSKGLERTDYKKIGVKLRDLVPCVLVTFDKEQIVAWRGKNYSGNTQPSSEEARTSAQATELSLLTECNTDYYASSVDHVSDPNAMKHNSASTAS